MDLESYKKVITKIKFEGLDPLNFQFNGQGEAFLHPLLPEFPNYAQLQLPGVRRSIITNGSVPRPLHDLTMFDFVEVSFNGGDERIYNAITKLNFQEVLKNIQSWKSFLIKSGSIHMLVFIDNVSSSEDFKKLFQDYPVSLAYKYDNQCGMLPDKTLTEWHRPYKIPCPYLFDVLYFTWDFHVPLCPHDIRRSVDFGCVLDKDIKEILATRLHSETVNQHLDMEFTGICKDCNFNTMIS